MNDTQRRLRRIATHCENEAKQFTVNDHYVCYTLCESAKENGRASDAFGLIATALLRSLERIDALEAENKTLRSTLAAVTEAK